MPVFTHFFNVKLRAQVQDLQKREFYDLPEHGTATTKARGGLGTIQTSWARRAIKIMAVDSCASTGTGLSLSKELVAVVRENDMEVKVIGMDGCSVNTGIHAGAIRLTELELGYAIQWVICGLHLIELVFWHILSEVDGVTKGPNQLSGPEGQHIHGTGA